VQCYVEYAKRPLGLVLMLIMSVMAIEVALKKPLCIDSNIVHRIDRITKQKSEPHTESVLSCSQFKIEKFSSYFSENHQNLNRRLAAVSTQITGLGFVKPVHIEIHENKKQLHKVSATGVVISEDLMATAEFESLVLQAILLQKTKGADEPSVKMIADYLMGAKPKNDYITDLWFRSNEKLSAVEKIQLKLAVQRHLGLFKNFKNESSLENIIQFIASQPKNEKFKIAFHENMQNAQLVGENSKFDLLIQINDIAQIDLKQLQTQAKLHFKKVALQTENGIYVLPYMVPLKEESAQNLKVQMRLVISTKNSENKSLDGFIGNTEHLILLSAQSSQSLRNSNYSDLLTDWKKFVAQNPKMKFVKVHIPSLQYISKKTHQSFKLHQLMSEAGVQMIGHKNLGWTQVKWDQGLKAYQPVAFHDAVQFYRLN
jgi:hypothetical protein